MRNLVCGLFALGFLTSSQIVYANKPVVAVFEIQNKAKLSKDAVEQLTDVIATELSASQKYQVVPRSDLKTVLAKKKSESYETCYDESCQIEIGKELAAEKTLATKVIRLGKTCIVTMQLFDLRKSASENAAKAKGKCGVENVLTLIEAALKSLLGTNKVASIPASRGQSFATVELNGLEWTNANVAITKLRNGAPIHQVFSRKQWKEAFLARTPAFAFYGFKKRDKRGYGAYYNYWAVSDARGFAPKGWRLPSKKDVDGLASWLGGVRTDRGTWSSPSAPLRSVKGWTWRGDGEIPEDKENFVSGTNSTGFNAIPAGKLSYEYKKARWLYLGNYAAWWTRTPSSRKIKGGIGETLYDFSVDFRREISVDGYYAQVRRNGGPIGEPEGRTVRLVRDK